MNESGQELPAPAAPLTDEDRYADAVALLESIPDENQPAVADETPAAPQSDGANPGVVATGSTTADPPQSPPEAELFEGFAALPDSAKQAFHDLQARLDRASGDRKAAIDRVAPLQRQLAQLQRDIEARKGAPAQQRAEHIAEKWAKHKENYPEDAEAIEDLLRGFQDDLANKALQPLVAEIAQLRQFRDEVMQDRAAQRIERAQSSLDDMASNWRQIAGWVDDKGNDVAPEERKFHPEFERWVESKPVGAQARIRRDLEDSDPEVVGDVFARFNSEYFGPQVTSNAAPADSAAARRAAALTDVTPGATRTGFRGNAKPTFRQQVKTPEDEYAEQMEAIERLQRSRKVK